MKQIFVIEGEKITDMEEWFLNPMVFYQGFQHITEQIFEKMEIKSLQSCREVTTTWQICIDDRNILWNKLVKRRNFDGNLEIQLACQFGHSKMAKILIQKSDELNIDLNNKKCALYTTFAKPSDLLRSF